MQAGESNRGRNSSRGAALLAVLLVMMLASSLALAIALITALETRAASNFRGAGEALYAADAGIELALPDLASSGNWTAVLDGSTVSTFLDGAAGPRTLSDGRSLNLVEVVNQSNCGHVAACSAAETDAVTETRPWGPNNPNWRLYMCGPLSSLWPGQMGHPSCYIVVLVADDPSETDGDPQRDGVVGQNPGAGILLVRAEAFCAGGAQRIIEATVSRPGSHTPLTAGIRLLTWREVRDPAM
jgi:hypothetical protein